MNNFQKWAYKNNSWIFLNFPAFFMLIALFYKPSLCKIITSYSGYIALILLIIVLALNPLQIIIPRFSFAKKVNKFRRQIGVAVFSYSLIHFICFFIKRGYNVSETLRAFLYPALLPAVIALIIFSLLALTSNNYSIKKLGSRRWKKLHQFVYVAEGMVFLHMVLLGDIFYALLAFVPLFVLQFLRVKKKALK